MKMEITLIKFGIVLLLTLTVSLLFFRPSKSLRNRKVEFTNGLRLDFLLTGFLGLSMIFFLQYFLDNFSNNKLIYGLMIGLTVLSLLKMVKNNNA